MNTITLSHVLPAVFAAEPPAHSDVWMQDLTIGRGEICLVEAASGTGKSSLCAYLTGYRRDYSGQILFDDQDISRMGVGEWTTTRRLHLSNLFQDLRLFPDLTAWENVQIKNRLTRRKPDSEIRQWFDELGIADKMQARVGQMSFGQQQRVALMRALCQPFDFLLADEPVSHLDEANASIMASIMLRESQRQGSTLVVTSIGKHPPLPYTRTLSL